MVTDKNRVVVEGVNYIQKHLRKSQQYPQGGRIRREAAIHISNVMPIDPSDNGPTRVSWKVGPDGKRIRVSRRTGTAWTADADDSVKGAKAAKRGGSED
jgi:large subunit ribosomal protein L24